MNQVLKFIFRKSQNWHWSIELLKWAIVGIISLTLVALTTGSVI